MTKFQDIKKKAYKPFPNGKEESSYYRKMRGYVKGSVFGTLAKAKQDSLLRFFEPEWNSRDGAFLGKLKDQLSRGCPQPDQMTLSAWQAYRASLRTHPTMVPQAGSLASFVNATNMERRNSMTMSFGDGMSSLMWLAAFGLVHRVKPFQNDRLVPVFFFSIDTTPDLTKFMFSEQPPADDFWADVTNTVKAHLPKEKPVINVGTLPVAEAKKYFEDVDAGIQRSGTTLVGATDAGAAIAKLVTKFVEDTLAVALPQSATKVSSNAEYELAEIRQILADKGLPTSDLAAMIRTLRRGNKSPPRPQ